MLREMNCHECGRSQGEFQNSLRYEFTPLLTAHQTTTHIEQENKDREKGYGLGREGICGSETVITYFIKNIYFQYKL